MTIKNARLDTGKELYIPWTPDFKIWHDEHWPTDYYDLPILLTGSPLTLKLLKDNDYWIIAADAHGKENYFDIDYTNMNFALIMGGEETGVSKNNLKKSDFVVKIPMLRDFNSLNVSNAASAIIYESVRQMIQTKNHSV